MDIRILRPNDCYEAVYINGKLVCEAHSVDVFDLAQAVIEALGEGSFALVDTFKIDDDSRFEWDKDGVDYLDGKPVWINGKGCPTEWPFE